MVAQTCAAVARLNIFLEGGLMRTWKIQAIHRRKGYAACLPKMLFILVYRKAHH